MTDEEIDKALTASGDCEECGGRGAARDHYGSSQQCWPCRGTGRDPNALLRAVQAIGFLFLRRPT